MNSTAALARQAGMTDAQWKEAVKSTVRTGAGLL